MKTYEVWKEGFRVTGDYGTAYLKGTCQAESFEEACVKICGKDPNFNKERLSVWGCGLYRTEKLARRSFG